MTTQTTHPPYLLPMTDEEVAGAYAAAYAAGDIDALRDLLHPDVECRLLMPADVQSLRGAEAFIEGLAAAVAAVDGYRPHSSSVTPMGERFATRSRLVLEAEGGHYQLEHQEFVTVRGGRIVAIDGVCSGFRPVATGAETRR